MSNSVLGNHSLTQRLLIYLLIPVLLIISFAAAVAIVMASRSVNSLYDQQMKNNAEILLAFLHYEYAEEADGEVDDHSDTHFYSDVDISEELIEIVSNIETTQDLSVSYRFSINNTILFTSAMVRYFPPCTNGYSNFKTSKIGHAREVVWRCFKKTQSIFNTGLPIDVEFFEPVTQRQQAIRSLLLTTFSPILLLPVVVLLVAWWAVLRGMRSLIAVSEAVSMRSVDNLKRIPSTGQPAELLPVVNSVNGLLAGVELGVLREKQFTDDAAHELRTPLTSIKMLEQLIRRDNTNPAIANYLDNLRDSANHSSILIDQLLELARLQSTRSLKKTDLNLRDVIDTQLGLLSPQITAKSLAVNFAGNDKTIVITAHKPSLSLLINNLLINAIKFSANEGTIHIDLSTSTLRIEDDGPGIKVEDRPRVFDRFFRAASNRITQGSGLGLSLAKRVADNHGFQLFVEPPVIGTGANFVLKFNLARS